MHTFSVCFLLQNTRFVLICVNIETAGKFCWVLMKTQWTSSSFASLAFYCTEFLQLILLYHRHNSRIKTPKILFFIKFPSRFFYKLEPPPTKNIKNWYFFQKAIFLAIIKITFIHLKYFCACTVTSGKITKNFRTKIFSCGRVKNFCIKVSFDSNHPVV